MVDVDGSRSFDVTADALWAVVADPARLSDWVPTMRVAEPQARPRCTSRVSRTATATR